MNDTTYPKIKPLIGIFQNFDKTNLTNPKIRRQFVASLETDVFTNKETLLQFSNFIQSYHHDLTRLKAQLPSLGIISSNLDNDIRIPSIASRMNIMNNNIDVGNSFLQRINTLYYQMNGRVIEIDNKIASRDANNNMQHMVNEMMKQWNQVFDKRLYQDIVDAYKSKDSDKHDIATRILFYMSLLEDDGQREMFSKVLGPNVPLDTKIDSRELAWLLSEQKVKIGESFLSFIYPDGGSSTDKSSIQSQGTSSTREILLHFILGREGTATRILFDELQRIKEKNTSLPIGINNGTVNIASFLTSDKSQEKTLQIDDNNRSFTSMGSFINYILTNIKPIPDSIKKVTTSVNRDIVSNPINKSLLSISEPLFHYSSNDKAYNIIMSLFDIL